MEALSQRDPRWRNVKLGTSDKAIGEAGCTITALSIILGTTPDLVNHRINEINGYAQGNLVIWAKLEEAFPGIKIRRVWTYDNDDVKASVPNVLVEVDGKPIGGYRHWLVYIGNRKALDPWDGKEKSTTDYSNPLSYCVIGGKWNKPSPQSDLQVELNKVRKERDDNHDDRMALYSELGFDGKFNRVVAVTEIRQLKEIAKKSGEKDEELKKLREELSAVREELRVAKEKIEELQITAQQTSVATDIVSSQVDTTIAKTDDIEKKIDASVKDDEPLWWETLIAWILKLFSRK